MQLKTSIKVSKSFQKISKILDKFSKNFFSKIKEEEETERNSLIEQLAQSWKS